jgi:hypothetical protein
MFGTPICESSKRLLNINRYLRKEMNLMSSAGPFKGFFFESFHPPDVTNSNRIMGRIFEKRKYKDVRAMRACPNF